MHSCPFCDFTADRDVNAVRNICRRALAGNSGMNHPSRPHLMDRIVRYPQCICTKSGRFFVTVELGRISYIYRNRDTEKQGKHWMFSCSQSLSHARSSQAPAHKTPTIR
ncbi:MAG: transposase [Candidatus Methanomethylophilus sp.]|nr:transposase [Methanomethylophilus sp.]